VVPGHRVRRPSVAIAPIGLATTATAPGTVAMAAVGYRPVSKSISQTLASTSA
jgi:hypothetical protein